MTTYVSSNGLTIQELVVGQGPEASSGNPLIVNYLGTLDDGTVFDSTYTLKSPFSFQSGAGIVIPGFEQGVIGMKVGGKRKLVIPPELAYGDKINGLIPANSTLNFEVQLLSTSYDLKKNSTYAINPPFKDYDGNVHGYLNEAPEDIKPLYKYQGTLDVNNDGVYEFIFTNQGSGRWATSSIDPITGFIDSTEYGEGGSTRIVGIYEDPLVANGTVQKDSDFDSSKTFFNDLKLDNLILKTVGDFDGDGFQELYWSKVDNTAYLRAVMHADGNIQYANYQNLDQMTNYLTSNGFADTVALIA
ncbi:FKBP-type peptidyl-prolyl cis-trans isomerase [Prochlorococcus marinus]|uniref:FKBP-type peptidyl-prolyl cis-trans isomerase n=1 Tax=Prochlorococcus marinus TaxID=1219 RepID=UPI0022B46D57|nr:FKBP-type peptidyl-prolyl cis-trans isomerase [Prochlorococcus marinus]